MTRKKAKPKTPQQKHTRLKRVLAKARKRGMLPDATPVKKKSPHSPAHLKAFTDWKAGTPLLTLCKNLDIHSGHTLTKIFIAIAGGKDAYVALRKGGAGGGHIPFGGKPFHRKKGEGAVHLDDRKVPRIKSTDVLTLPMVQTLVYAAKRVKEIMERLKTERNARTKRFLDTELTHNRAVLKTAQSASKGRWTAQVYDTPFGNAVRLTDPKGVNYVRAKATERADVVVETKDFSPTRYKSEQHASSTKHAKREAKLVAKGEKLLSIRKKKHAKAARRHK